VLVCHVVFPAVPAGKRLILTYASAEFALAPGGLFPSVEILEDDFVTATGIALPAPAREGPSGDSYVAAGPITLYVEAGKTPTMFVDGQFLSTENTATTTLVGYLVSTTQATSANRTRLVTRRRALRLAAALRAATRRVRRGSAGCRPPTSRCTSAAAVLVDLDQVADARELAGGAFVLAGAACFSVRLDELDVVAFHGRKDTRQAGLSGTLTLTVVVRVVLLALGPLFVNHGRLPP
jgi:hypothetical protein